MTQPARPDAGFTLIEILVAVALLGIAVTAIVSGMMTSILTTDVHRKQATGESVMRGYAEAAKSSATASYSSCATTYAITGFNPNGYSMQVAVDYWDAGSSSWKPQPAPNCLTVNTVQRLRLAVWSEDRRSEETVQLVVRKPTL